MHSEHPLSMGRSVVDRPSAPAPPTQDRAATGSFLPVAHTVSRSDGTASVSGNSARPSAVPRGEADPAGADPSGFCLKDNGFGALAPDHLNEGRRVIALIYHLKQHLGLAVFRVLPGRQQQACRISQHSHGRVDLGAQSASGFARQSFRDPPPTDHHATSSDTSLTPKAVRAMVGATDTR